MGPADRVGMWGIPGTSLGCCTHGRAARAAPHDHGPLIMILLPQPHSRALPYRTRTPEVPKAISEPACCAYVHVLILRVVLYVFCMYVRLIYRHKYHFIVARYA
jgi:hypothetical protein